MDSLIIDITKSPGIFFDIYDRFARMNTLLINQIMTGKMK